MKDKPKLTQALIDRPGALPCPEGRTHCEYPAGDRSGLYLDVRPDSIIKSFYLRAKNQQGKSYSTFIGRSNLITLKEAKEKVRILKGQIASGKDLQGEARERKKVMTWNHYMNTIYIPHVNAHLRSAANLVSLNEKYLEPHIGHLALNKISLELATKLHRDMVEEKGLSHASADHMAKLLRQAMNHAVRLNLLSTSPVSKIRLFNIDNREERLMSDAELRRLIAVLDTDHNRMVCMVVKWLLFTGARVNSEALQARWTDIDRENRTWLILATNSKSKQRRAVPLNNAAMAVLDQLGTEGKSEWLFTSSKGGGRLTTISKPWLRIRKVANLSHCRLHDLRHMHASMLVNSGRTLYEVQQILGHSDPSVTQRYAHLSTATLQDAANSVGTYLDKVLGRTGE